MNSSSQSSHQMTNTEKERICRILKAAADFTPTLDPAETLANLANPQMGQQQLQELIHRADVMIDNIYVARHKFNLNLVKNRLTKREIFLLGYVPFVIAELVWDYADSVINTAAFLREPYTRRISRAIRQLKQSYDKKRFHFIDEETRRRELENAEIFEEIIRGHASQLLMHIRTAIANQTPNLLPDWRTFHTAVYQCHVLSRALIAFTEAQEAKTAARLGQSLFHVLPIECYNLNNLLPEYFGDMPPKEQFQRTLDQYVRTFAAKIAGIQYNDIVTQ